MTPSPLTLPALFEERIRWMRGHRYAKRTLESSQSSLEKFRCWCEAKQIHHLAEVNPALIENYQQWLPHQKSERGRPWSIRYQYHLLSEIITCFRWAYRQGYLLSDPCLTIQRPRLPQTLPRHLLSLQELEMLLRLPELGKPHGLRDRAILEVFYATAIRCKELLNLSIHDLDRRSEMIHIRQGKGEKDRIIPISERALKWVARYELEVREKWQLKGKGADFLFLSEQGKPFSQTQCEKRHCSLIIPEKRL